MLDAFEPLQVHNAERGQRQADSEQNQSHIKPPASKGKNIYITSFRPNDNTHVVMIQNITESPFDITIVHDVAEEIYVVCHSYGCYDPENGVSVNARERFFILFILT